MHALFLDVASNVGIIALIKDDQVLVIRTLDHRISDGDLIPLVEDVLKESKGDYNSLTHIACVTGPGGFTSLRVGIAFANALAWDKKIPLGGIHLSDLYAARTNEKDFLWLHSTKKQEIFIRGFGSFAKDFPEAKCQNVESLELPSGGWVGELIPEHRERFNTLTPLSLKPLEEILPDFMKELTFGTESLLPWYGRQW